MQLVGVTRSPYTRRVAITLELYGIPYRLQALSGFGNREEVRAANPLGRLTHADIAAFVAERLARGLGIDTDTEMPRLRALAARLADRPAFGATEPQ